jgi:hypothetical protein
VRLAIKPSRDDRELSECVADKSLPWLVLAAAQDERALTNALNPKYTTPPPGAGAAGHAQGHHRARPPTLVGG